MEREREREKERDLWQNISHFPPNNLDTCPESQKAKARVKYMQGVDFPVRFFFFAFGHTSLSLYYTDTFPLSSIHERECV